MRKIILCITLFLLLICSGCISAYAASESDLTYTISNETVTITGCNTSATGELIIPETLDGYPVTKIGNRSFRNCSGLTCIIIPEGVISIGDSAFEGCIGITSVTIPESVSTVGAIAFRGCTGLKKVNVANIASWCAIDFGSSDANPLCYAEKLYLDGTFVSDLVIPDGVTSIGGVAFIDCTGIKSISIPDSVKSIGWSAFEGCIELTSVTIPDGVIDIASGAFEGCTALKSISIPSSVTSIGYLAFSDCSSLVSVNIPEGITNIGYGTFYGCNSLASLTIPDSVTCIDSDAFYGCRSLEKVNITNLESWCNIVFGNVYSNPLNGMCDLYLDNNIITNLVIPNSVTSISKYAFYGCASLTSVTIPYSVTSVEYYSFENCVSLTDVYYYGTEGEWGFISIGRNNEPFTRATIHYVKHSRTMISVDGKEFTIMPINMVTGKTIILVLYDGRKFLEMQYATYEGEEITFTTAKKYTNAKVMVWDSLTNLKPVCGAETVK